MKKCLANALTSYTGLFYLSFLYFSHTVSSEQNALFREREELCNARVGRSKQIAHDEDQKLVERLVPRLICSLQQNICARCAHGNQLRDFLYVTDVAHVFVKLLDSELQGLFNVASGKPISIKELVTAIARKFDMLNFLEFGAVQSPINDPPLLAADILRLTQDLHRRQQIDLVEGINRTIQYFKQSDLN